VHNFLIILSQYKNYIDETFSSSLSSSSCSCILSNESSNIAPSSAIPMSLSLFFPFKYSWSLLFFFSQIYSFTLHLKFLTIVTHLIYRILTLFETIVCNKILFKFEDNKKQTLFKKTNFSFPNR